MGRPTKLTLDLIGKAEEYLKLCTDADRPVDETLEPQPHGGALKREKRLIVKLPTKGGLAKYLGVSRDSLYEWAKNDDKFSDIMEQLGSEQEDRLINFGLSGDYNPTIAKVLLTKHGYHDKVESEITNPDGSLNPYNALTAEELRKLANK